MLSDWLISLYGTEAGHRFAILLAILAAFLHALFGALQKGRHDPWLTRGVIDVCYGLMAMPVALFVVPWPEPHMWPIFAVVVLIHVGYKVSQAQTYTLGSYLVVYPVVRGTGPVFTVIGAYLLFAEVFRPVQWFGVGLLVSGIFGLAAYNFATTTVNRSTLVPALLLAVLTGGFVATYTTYDAYGIRATADPFTFLAWFFFLDGMVLPLIALRRWMRIADRPALGPLFARGVLGALVAMASFGSILLATRIDAVGQAAVLRETSVIFAALIGWVLLKEKTGRVQLSLLVLIALGAVVVEMGG